MAIDKKTYAIFSVAAVVLIAAIIMNVSYTGRVIEGPYKCISYDHPDRIIETATGHVVYNCPGTAPYCDPAAAAAGAPRCCGTTDFKYGCIDYTEDMNYWG